MNFPIANISVYLNFNIITYILKRFVLNKIIENMLLFVTLPFVVTMTTTIVKNMASLVTSYFNILHNVCTLLRVLHYNIPFLFTIEHSTCNHDLVQSRNSPLDPLFFFPFLLSCSPENTQWFRRRWRRYEG